MPTIVETTGVAVLVEDGRPRGTWNMFDEASRACCWDGCGKPTVAGVRFNVGPASMVAAFCDEHQGQAQRHFYHERGKDGGEGVDIEDLYEELNDTSIMPETPMEAMHTIGRLADQAIKLCDGKTMLGSSIDLESMSEFHRIQITTAQLELRHIFNLSGNEVAAAAAAAPAQDWTLARVDLEARTSMRACHRKVEAALRDVGMMHPIRKLQDIVHDIGVYLLA